MSTQPVLSNGATQLLNSFSISENDKAAIVNCIAHYSSPLGVQSVAFRALNALRALGGCSEWQMTVKRITNSDNLSNDELKQRVYEVADSFLRLVLRCHQDNITETPDKVLEIFRQPSLSKNKGALVFSPEELQKVPREFLHFAKTLKEHAPYFLSPADVRVSLG